MEAAAATSQCPADLGGLLAGGVDDATDNDPARRCEGHPRSTDLTVTVLLDTAEQSLYLHRPQDVLRLVRLASATGNSRKHSANRTP